MMIIINYDNNDPGYFKIQLSRLLQQLIFLTVTLIDHSATTLLQKVKITYEFELNKINSSF